MDRIDVYLSPSTRADKKWMVKIEGKTVHFGASGYEDYTMHGDDKRKDSYIARHSARENWDDPHTAGFWSRWLLWNEPTIEDSIADIEKYSKLNIIQT